MLSAALSWLVKSKGMKLGAGAVSGSGILLLIFNLHNDVSAKIEKQNKGNKEYVQLSLRPLQRDILHLSKEQAETKSLIRDIHNYLLKSKSN